MERVTDRFPSSTPASSMRPRPLIEPNCGSLRGPITVGPMRGTRRSTGRRCWPFSPRSWSDEGGGKTAACGATMRRYVLSRCGQAVPVLFGVTLITFLLTHVALGDPVRAMMGQRADPEVVARIRAEYGLDKPLWHRYALYMGKLLVGDLGYSYRQGRPVSETLAERLPATVRLAVAAMVVAVVLGMAAGIVAAVRHNTGVDLLMMTLSLLGISTPVFWLGMMLILLFAVSLGWFPISGYGDGAFGHLVLPALTLGALQAGSTRW